MIMASSDNRGCTVLYWKGCLTVHILNVPLKIITNAGWHVIRVCMKIALDNLVRAYVARYRLISKRHCSLLVAEI